MSRNTAHTPLSNDPTGEEDLPERMIVIPKDAQEGGHTSEHNTHASMGARPNTERTTHQYKQDQETELSMEQRRPAEVKVGLAEPVRAPQKPRQPNRSERIGDILRDARQERGDDLYMIAEYLCIKPSFLIALENSRYDEFPADAYVIGFLRTYANFLGVNGKEAVDRYRYEMAGRRKKPILSMPTPVSEGRTPSVMILVGAAVTLVIIYAIWSGFSSSDRAAVHMPPPLPESIVPIPTVSTSPAAAGLTAPIETSKTTETTPNPAAQTTETPPSEPAPQLENTTPTPPPPSQPAQPAMSTPPSNVVPLAPTPQITPPPPATQGKALTISPTAMPTTIIPPASPGIIVSVGKPPEPVFTREDARAATPTAAKTPPKTETKVAEPKTEAKSPVQQSDPPAPKTPPPPPVEERSRILIRATQNSWVMIVDRNGKTVFDSVLKQGESYSVPMRPGLSLTTGNGSGIRLSVDGRELPRIPGDAEQVVRGISLDPDKLKNEFGSTNRW